MFDAVYSNETGSFYKECRKACKKEHQHAQGNNQTVDFWLPLSSRSSFGPNKNNSWFHVSDRPVKNMTVHKHFIDIS